MRVTGWVRGVKVISGHQVAWILRAIFSLLYLILKKSLATKRLFYLLMFDLTPDMGSAWEAARVNDVTRNHQNVHIRTLYTTKHLLCSCGSMSSWMQQCLLLSPTVSYLSLTCQRITTFTSYQTVLQYVRLYVGMSVSMSVGM